MEKLKFYIVDVFCRGAYSGNQLAVVLLEFPLDQERMQAIAREFNFSETTFIQKYEENSVRIFTPNKEIPFAGHPTIGTAFVLRNEVLKAAQAELSLNLKIGKIKIVFENDITWMRQKEPVFNEVYKPFDIASILGVNETDVNELFPIQAVSTGFEFIIIPLKSLDAVKRCRVNLNKYYKHFNKIEPKPFLIFTSETYEESSSLNCRVFADHFGVPEDPATGSGNGNLAAYLSKYKYFEIDSIDISVEQGFEINRKSKLYLRTKNDSNKYNVEVGGKIKKVAEGSLLQ